MTTVVSGLADTGDVLAGRLIVDMSDKIALLEDDKISLSKLLSKLPKKPAGNTTVKWMTDEIVPKSDALNGSISSDTTAVTVDNGAFFQKNDVIKLPVTGETCLVTAVSSNTLTVTRSWGTIAAATCADNSEVLNLGPAFAEGAHLRVSDSDDTPLAKRVTEVQKSNYTQIWRHALSLSRTAMQSKMYAGDDRPYQRRKKMIEHVQAMNLDLYHGEAATSSQRQTIGGILEFTNSANAMSTATLTEAQFNTDLRTAFRYGKGKKILFASRQICGIISEFATNVQRVEPGESKFGVAITQYQSPHGMVDIVADHALEGTTYNKYAVLLDPTAVRMRPMQDTILRVDVQSPDVDGVVDEYLTEASVEWGHDKHHAYWNAVTS